MNPQAVALAADSAVTLVQERIRGDLRERKHKIFTSANKIFTLSKYHPVGIMIYNNATCMGTPWETIIKMYRTKLGERQFKTISEYCEDFIKFVQTDGQFFKKKQEQMHVHSMVEMVYEYLRKEIRNKIKEIITRDCEIKMSEIHTQALKEIGKHYKLWKSEKYCPYSSTKDRKQFEDEYGELIKSIINSVFEKLPLSAKYKEQLYSIGLWIFTKFPESIDHSEITGIVITGFGKDEIYPCYCHFLISGVINRIITIRKLEGSKIGPGDHKAHVAPFAQTDMIHLFMRGILPEYKIAIDVGLERIAKEFPELLVDSIKKLNAQEKLKLKKRAKRISKNLFSNFISQVEALRDNLYSKPIVDIVGILPKDELALMAETLINLTSFKRRVSMEAETVGGPIDVAIISKTDGFIWIKRKHYFKSELNPYFFQKYFMSD